MERDIDILTRGLYKHSTIKNFIRVKNYMFVRKHNKKYLALRFVNDSETTFDSMAFTLVALDSVGNVIERIPISYKNIALHPSEEFTGNKMVRVKPECCDFKVIFDKVFAGSVVYTEQGGHAVARYSKKSSLNMEEITSHKDNTPKPPKKHGFLMGLISILLVAVILVANIIYIVSAISNENDIRRERYEQKLKEEREKESEAESYSEALTEKTVG